MRDFYQTNPNDINNPVLRAAVRRYKEDEGGRKVMCELVQKLVDEGEARGYKRGKAENDACAEIRGAIKLLISRKVPNDEIVAELGVTMEQIEEAKATMPSNGN